MDKVLGNIFYKLLKIGVEHLKCNEEVVSIVPTLLVLVSGIRLVYQLTNSMFRRSMFRRVPLWETCLQDAINMVLVIHFLRAWFLYTRILRWIIDKVAEQNGELFQFYVGPNKTVECLLHLIICWSTASFILVLTILSTLPRDDGPHLLIWIATSPWRYTEIGPTAYYLHRPIQESRDSRESTENDVADTRMVQSMNNMLVKKTHGSTKRSKSV